MNDAAATAEDLNTRPCSNTAPDSRDELSVLTAFLDDLDQRSATATKSLPTQNEQTATHQFSTTAFLDSLEDSDLTLETWKKTRLRQNDTHDTPQMRETPATSHTGSRRMTAYTILLDLVNNRDRPPTTERFNKYVEFISACPSDDLPATLAKLLVAEDARFEQSQQEVLVSAWQSGHQTNDLEHWLAMLKAPTSEAMVEIFLSRNSLQPTFLLDLILRPSAIFTERSTLISLLRYIATWYAEGKTPLSGKSVPEPLRTTIRLLVSHCCRSWPELLPVVARVVASHIRTGIANTFPPNEVYAKRTRTYNYYLQLFATAPDRRALRYMPFVWEAQRVLLTMSSELQEPLILERKSFLAIRLVLLGLRKTEEERDAALRWGRTWPPYKIDRDGLDEQKDPEDEYTRPIQAGITMQESGYSRQPIDDLIDTLAGIAPDGTPTIQHRANILRLIKHGHKIGGEEVWATKIRATRNAHEAWIVFQHPPSEWPCRCGPKVYAEMFKKLTAETANSDHYLPGDGHFAVEVQIPNLSDFEKARRQPPSVERLYSQMLDEGIRPNGHCLTVLLQGTTRFRDFNKYLHHSNLDDDVVEWIIGHGEQHLPDISDRLPFGVLQAYIKLLCNRQPRATSKSPPVALRKLVQKAVRLVMEYADSARADGRRFIDTRPLWTMILERVCKPMGVYFSEKSVAHNFFQTLLLYIDVLREARVAATPNDDMFLYTAIALRHAVKDQFRKCLRLRPGAAGRRAVAPEGALWTQLKTIRGEARGEVSIWELRERHARGEIGQLDVIVSMSRHLTARFWRMSEPVAPLVAPDGSEYATPARLYDMRGTEVHVYMQTLGQLGDLRAMTRLLGWIADAWGGELGVKDRYHLTRAVACYRVLGEAKTRRALRREGLVGEAKAGEEDDLRLLEEEEPLEEDGPLEGAAGELNEGEGPTGELDTDGSGEMSPAEAGDAALGAADEGGSERVKERLRGMGAWPDLEQVAGYLGTSAASTEMFEVLLRIDKLKRKGKA